MKLTAAEIAGMMDLSSVRPECDENEIRRLAAEAARRRGAAAFSLPCFTPLLRELLPPERGVAVGAVAGFPGGCVTTATKVAETRELVAMGADEIDMVINVAMLLSGREGFVRDDMRAVVEAAGGVPVKVILECHHLTDAHIRTGCGLAIGAGASWVKTGTGWAPTGATLENIALMKSCVGDAVKIKAAGGVRGIDTLAEMHRRGARRFGVGLSSGLAIIEQVAALPNGTFEF